MAPKRSLPLENPPAASSSEEESSSDFSSEEEEDQESTQVETPIKSSITPSSPAVGKKSREKKPDLAVKSLARSSSSDSGASSESATDSDTEAGRNAKPMEETQVETPIKFSITPSSPAVGKKSREKKPDLAVKSLARSSSSDSGSSSESATDSDTEAGRNAKEMEETPNAKKPRHNKSSVSATPAETSSKAPSEIRDSKRFKKGSEAEADEEIVRKSSEESKKLFQRLWSEEDEVAILNGMMDYSAKIGADPALDMNAFHEFIKKSVHVDVSKAQVTDKIRRLKKKYTNNAKRGKKGADPTFSKTHELKVFELSKTIWGGGDGEGIGGAATEQPKPSANGTPKNNQIGSTSRARASSKTEFFSSADVSKENENLEVERPSDCLNGFTAYDKFLGGAVGLPESLLKLGFDLIGKSKRMALEEEWKNLHIAELELFLRRTALIQDQAKLILEAYNASEK